MPTASETPGDPGTTVEIWTDGGCKPNPGPGGWAAILRFRDTERELTGADPATTNNRMELTAAAAALETLSRPCRVVVHRLGPPQLAQRGRRPGGEHGSLAPAAGRGQAARDRVEMGPRPRRRRDERAC